MHTDPAEFPASVLHECACGVKVDHYRGEDGEGEYYVAFCCGHVLRDSSGIIRRQMRRN